jgi:hypothetical protein
MKIWELILASSCRDLVARHETVIHGLVRKYRKGPRPRDKATGLEGADELSDENGTENQQDITKNINPDLQRTQDQGRSQRTTEEPTRVSEITQQMSLQNNLDPALMDNRGPQILSWNRAAQVLDLESGSSSSLPHGGGQIEFGGMGILAGLFDVAQDPFLSQSEWCGVSNQQISPDESVDMTHAGWQLQGYYQSNDPVLEFPHSASAERSAKHTDSLPLILERHQDQPIADFAPEDLQATVLDDLKKSIPAKELRELEFPRTRVLQKCLRSYIKSSNCHLPILHLTQILGSDTPSPLTLAMCSIGALYLTDRKNATLFKDLGTRALQTVSDEYYKFKINPYADFLGLQG